MSGEFFYCINILFTEKKRDRVRSVFDKDFVAIVAAANGYIENGK